MLYDLLAAPFVDYQFMRRALVGALALALAGSPLGVFLVLRRMSLAGDALSHAILPGAAMGYLVAGLSLPAMTLGGLAAGLAVALASGAAARFSALREDASLAAFYLVSLALGVTIVSLKGSNVDLLHVLFGSALALDDATLLLLAGVSTLTLFCLAVFSIARWSPTRSTPCSCAAPVGSASSSRSCSWGLWCSISSPAFTRWAR